MSEIPKKPQRQQAIIDFIQFEDETSLMWPWAIPAEKLLQDEGTLQKIAETVHLDDAGNYDTDDLYDAIGRIAGKNPAL